MNRRLLLCCALLSSASWGEDATVVIAGKISGADPRHTVRIALWAEPTFMKTPAQELVIAPGSPTTFRFVVPRGRWSISAFEDRNENGVLDMGLFGPKEPSGFWREFHGWHKPRFEEVFVQVDADLASADIAVH